MQQRRHRKEGDRGHQDSLPLARKKNMLFSEMKAREETRADDNRFGDFKKVRSESSC